MMNKVLLITMIMFSIMIAKNQFGLTKVNSIEQFLQNGNNPINTSNLEECNDPDACNYDSDAESGDGCIYVAGNECDCEGNMYDCSGVCGGEDTESCVIMNPKSMGFYDSQECSGEQISTLEGICLDDGNDFSINEEMCIAGEGMWMNFDTCYTMDFYTGSFIELDFESFNECMCGDGGIYEETIDEYGEPLSECIEGEEQLFTTWLSSAEFNELFNFSNNGPNLYFYENGDLGESNIDTDCIFLEIPSQEVCENAGGNYDDDSECNWDENTTEEECENLGGYWYYGDCEVDNTDTCIELGGEWDIDIDCDIPAIQSFCESAGGIYFSPGIHTIGNYTLNENSMILDFYNGTGPNDGGEEIAEIISNEDGTEIWINVVMDEICVNYTFSNDNNNAFSVLEISYLNIPQDYSFNQISPNPFNPVTNIEFLLNKIANVEISIFNILGESIQKIELGAMNIGQHAVQWNASELPSGVYFVQLNILENGKSASAQVQKALLIK